MKHYIRTLSILILSLAALSSRAQVDTLFWFAAPEVSHSVTAGVLDRPIYLRLTTYGQPATVTISQPAAGGMPVQTIAILANSTQSVDLTPWIDFIECKPANTILNYGLKITSTSPVSAYYDVVSGGGGATNNPEAFVLKGQSALGTDFLIPSQNYIHNVQQTAYVPTPYSSFDIIATENNTNITIIPSANITGHAAGSTFTIVLNEGQTWSGTAASQLASQHLQGSRVTSDKPIAVSVKDDLLDGAPFGGCADLVGDQIVPVPLLGTEYIAMRGQLNSPYDQLFITAVHNGTTITHNGTVVATINAGATHQVTVATPSSYIQTSQPVSVWQLSGIGCEVGSGQLPQIECTGSSSVSYTRATNTDLYFNLLVRNGGQGSFLVNGTAGVVTAGQFTAVPNTGGNWYTAQVSLPASTYPQGSVINISNNTLFHLGVLEGSARGGTSYGYFSNFSLASAEATASSGHVCVGDTIRLFAQAITGATYRWSGPGGFGSSQQNPVIQHATSSGSGVYRLEVSIPGCGSATDTVHVAVTEYPDVQLGNDVSLCVDSLTLRPLRPVPPGSDFIWNTGATADSIRVGQSNVYWLNVTSNGCTASDTVEVDLNGSLTVDLGPDVVFCDVDTPYVLTSPQPSGARYVWSNGWGYPALPVTRTGRYWLRVEHNGCVASDTVQMTMVPTPVVDLGNDTVICEQFPHRIGAEVAGATYSWNTGASDPYITVASSGSYILEVDVQACAVRDTIVITADPIPDINLGRDRYICQGQVISLDGSHGDGRQYLWSTGDTTAYFQASSPGTYSVVVTTHRGCVGKDTVVLTALPLPEIHLGTDTTVCEETPLVLRPFTMNAESLLWSDGSVGSFLKVSHGGNYTVSATNECGTVTDTIHIRQIFCDIWVPNVFTPNGDGKNDVFRVLGNVGRTEYFSLSIFDRWGQRVFYTSDKYQGWDGVYNGTPCMVGTFVYLLEYHIEGKPFIGKGNFHLLR